MVRVLGETAHEWMFERGSFMDIEVVVMGCVICRGIWFCMFRRFGGIPDTGMPLITSESMVVAGMSRAIG
jgi:hypothetical protein